MPVVEEEPEQNFKTLEQYLSEKNAKKSDEPVAVRRPNEGVDDSKWKDAVPLLKQEESLFAGKVYIFKYRI